MKIKSASESEDNRSILSEKRLKGVLNKKSINRKNMSKSISEKTMRKSEKTDRKMRRQSKIQSSKGFRKN